MFTINYNNEDVGIIVNGSLEEAMTQADDKAKYTQQPIIIEDEDGNEAARRAWYGYMQGFEGEENPLRIGDYGYYGDWSIRD